MSSSNASRLLKKPHMLRCAQSPRSNVLPKYASARRFFARLASEIFLSSLQPSFQQPAKGSARCCTKVQSTEFSLVRYACVLS